MQREKSPLRPPSDEKRESSRRQLIHLFCDDDSDEETHREKDFDEQDSSPGEIHDRTDWIRSRLAHELLESERKYVESLETLVQTFGPLVEDRLKEISPALSDLIRVIQVITGLNHRFLDELSVRMQSWNAQTKIGDVFLAFAPFLRMYSSYAIQHQEGTRVLHDLRQKGYSLSKLINGVSELEWRAGSLESFLILPVQRLPRYQLLFEQLSARTPPDHPDFQNLQNAFRQASSVAVQINEAVRNQENCFKILEIQNRFVGEVTLVAPHRRLIRSGTLIKVCRSTKQSREFFLFNDMLIYARNASGIHHGLKLNRQIFIDVSFEVYDVPSVSSKFPFEIRSSVKSFTVLAPSQEDKIEWLLRIMEVVDEWKRRKNTQSLSSVPKDPAPIWQPNDQSNSCSVCSNQFSVLFRRKHHCRRCGALVCAKCSRNRAFNSGAGSIDRICRVCVSHFRSAASSTSSCTLSNSTQTVQSSAAVDDDFSFSSSFREGLPSYSSDPALQALADEAIATVRRMSNVNGFQSGSDDFRPRSKSVAGVTARTRRPSVYEALVMEANRSFRRFSLSRLTSARRSSVRNLFGTECVLYLRAIMPRTFSTGSGLEFEIGDLISSDDALDGERCLGVNIRTSRKGFIYLTDMIELGHVRPGQNGCPGIANTAFDSSAYQTYSKASSRDRHEIDNRSTKPFSESRAAIPRNLLSLVVGQSVEVIDARSIEWWSGYDSAGVFGWFPAEYVTLACNPPTSSADAKPSCQLCSCMAFVRNVFDSSRCARCQHQLDKHTPLYSGS